MSDHTGIEWTERSGRALGVLKQAAQRVGLSFDDYIARRKAGQKHCVDCRTWKPSGYFNVDQSRYDGLAAKCRECSSKRGKESYTPVAPEDRAPKGPARIPRRDGDKIQARARINADIRMGHRADPDTLHCVYCGHIGPDRRHEYHHHMGYAAEHHYDVLPACAPCHRREERKNG